MKIKEFSYFLIGILFISGINNLFSMDPAIQLFMGIKTNSLEDVEKAIIAGADLNAKDVLSGKTALYEAIKNFYDQSNKPFDLKLGGTLAGLAGFFSSGYLAQKNIAHISDYYDSYKEEKNNYLKAKEKLDQYTRALKRNIKTGEKLPAKELHLRDESGKLVNREFEGEELTETLVNRFLENLTSDKANLFSGIRSLMGIFLAGIGSAFAVWSLGKASWRLRNKISTSWSIVSRIYFEMNKKGIIADEESVKFMEKLVPQLDAASKKLERKIKQ